MKKRRGFFVFVIVGISILIITACGKTNTAVGGTTSQEGVTTTVQGGTTTDGSDIHLEHECSGEWILDETHHWKVCDVCDEVCDKTLHSFDEGTTIKEATLEEAGSKTCTCTICGKTKEVEIPMLQTYTVTFFDYNNNVLEVIRVKEGDSVKAPEAKPVELFRFDEWDKSLENIHEDLEVRPIYEQIEFFVFFTTYDGEIFDKQIICLNEDAKAPIPPVRKGYVFDNWSTDYTNITKDTTVSAKYTKQFSVTFLNDNGKELKKEIVREGENATAPSSPEKEGYTFSNWDLEYTNVKEDLIITACYKIKEFDVKFIMPDNEEIPLSSQKVKYGFLAKEPEKPEYHCFWNEKGELKVSSFSNWNKSLVITENTIITAVYEKEYNLPLFVLWHYENNENEGIKMALWLPNCEKIYSMSFLVDYGKSDVIIGNVSLTNHKMNSGGQICEINNDENDKSISIYWVNSGGIDFSDSENVDMKKYSTIVDFGVIEIVDYSSVFTNDGFIEQELFKIKKAEIYINSGDEIVLMAPRIEYRVIPYIA